LLALLGVVVTVLVARGDGRAQDVRPPAAGAAAAGAAHVCPPGGVMAFPGTGEQSGLLYVVDTGRQRICVYRWMNPGIRLVAARAYDFDMEILDSAEDKVIEGRGATRGYVKAQVEAARRDRELKENR
jgi:hypothetical protein